MLYPRSTSEPTALQASAVLTASLVDFQWRFGDETLLDKRDAKSRQRLARKKTDDLVESSDE